MSFVPALTSCLTDPTLPARPAAFRNFPQLFHTESELWFINTELVPSPHQQQMCEYV
jgi:hypothetical protein